MTEEESLRSKNSVFRMWLLRNTQQETDVVSGRCGDVYCPCLDRSCSAPGRGQEMLSFRLGDISVT